MRKLGLDKADPRPSGTRDAVDPNASKGSKEAAEQIGLGAPPDRLGRYGLDRLLVRRK